MALFTIGGMLGFAHGAVLGVMGRPRQMSWRRAARATGLAALYTVPALTLAFLVAGWIALTPVALYTGKAPALIISGVAWLIGVGLISHAAVAGWRGLQAAYARWDEKRYGTLLVAATFAALLITFMAARPELWGLHLQVTEIGAVLMALSITLWFVGPMVTFALRVVKKLAVPGAAFDTPHRLPVDVLVGLVTGVVVGLIAVPFAAARGTEAGPAGAIVMAVSAALFNEVLLRLFVLTTVAALVMRWHAGRREQAVVIGVVTAAALEVVLHLPGVVTVGFPTAAGAAAFLATAVVVPALVFGMLFWKRGLITAVVAHATAIAAVAMLVA
jgi:hypothetical protein